MTVTELQQLTWKNMDFCVSDNDGVTAADMTKYGLLCQWQWRSYSSSRDKIWTFVSVTVTELQQLTWQNMDFCVSDSDGVTAADMTKYGLLCQWQWRSYSSWLDKIWTFVLVTVTELQQLTWQNMDFCVSDSDGVTAANMTKYGLLCQWQWQSYSSQHDKIWTFVSVTVTEIQLLTWQNMDFCVSDSDGVTAANMTKYGLLCQWQWRSYSSWHDKIWTFVSVTVSELQQLTWQNMDFCVSDSDGATAANMTKYGLLCQWQWRSYSS